METGCIIVLCAFEKIHLNLSEPQFLVFCVPFCHPLSALFGYSVSSLEQRLILTMWIPSACTIGSSAWLAARKGENNWLNIFQVMFLLIIFQGNILKQSYWEGKDKIKKKAWRKKHWRKNIGCHLLGWVAKDGRGGRTSIFTISKFRKNLILKNQSKSFNLKLFQLEMKRNKFNSLLFKNSPQKNILDETPIFQKEISSNILTISLGALRYYCNINKK